MKRIIDTSEVLGTVDTDAGPCEVCALADAGYDEEKRKLVVHLESSLRTTDLLKPETHPRAEWLPKSQTIVESVGWDEALEVARDIFGRWVRRVREASPSLHSPRL